MKKFVFAFFAVLALSLGCAFADEPAAQEAEDKTLKKDAAGNPIDLKTKDGLRIAYMGTFRIMAAPEEGGEEKVTDKIVSVFMVKADRDMTLWVNAQGGVDTKTNKFSCNDDWCHIAGNSNRQVEILEDIWMRVEFFHVLPLDKFSELPRIGRFFEFAFAEAGKEPCKLVYKKIRVQPWKVWKEVEKKVIAMEEDEEDIEDGQSGDAQKAEGA
ncbi:MAG: hypothetical protein K6E38_02805 [Fretibacterium sp.]|nr:hypothetical protein [Fretibacterium sp.]